MIENDLALKVLALALGSCRKYVRGGKWKPYPNSYLRYLLSKLLRLDGCSLGAGNLQIYEQLKTVAQEFTK